MHSLGRQRPAILCLALLNMLPAIQAEESWGVLAIAVACAVLSVVLARRDGSPRVPGFVIQIAVLASVAYLLFEMFGHHDEPTVYILDLGHFMIFLCCCKFFEIKRNRDVNLIILISFLLLVIGAFVSASLTFAAVLLVDVTLGVAWLLAFQNRSECDALNERIARLALTRGLRATTQGPVSRHADAHSMTTPEKKSGKHGARLGVRGGRAGYWRRGARQGGSARPTGLISGSLACSAGLVIISTVLFVAVPRGWGRGLFGRMHQMVPNTTSGFTDEVELRGTAVYDDQTPVMRARFTLRDKVVGGEHFQPYLRGTTFDRYENGRWEKTHGFSQGRRRTGRGRGVSRLTRNRDILVSQDMIEQEIWLEKIEKGYLFSMYPPLTFASDDIASLQEDPLDLCLQAGNRPSGPVHYVIHTLTQDWIRPREGTSNADRPPRIEAPPRQLTRADETSRIHPAVREFARNFFRRFGDAGNPATHEYLCQRLEGFLSSGEYEYTLNRDKPPYGADPIKDFLLDDKQGHCEYFASAMTLLCQAVGIPARLVSGYCAGEWNPVDERYLFRQKDAHAWVEVWLQDRGWITFDPSPAADARRKPVESGWFAWSGRLMELIRLKWSSMVLAFDAESRSQLTARLSHWYRTAIRDDEGYASFGQIAKALLWGPEHLENWQRVFYWLLLVLCVAFVALAARVVWIIALMVRAYVPSPAHREGRMMRRPEAKFYDRVMVLLANKGHVRPPHVTQKEFAAGLAARYRQMSELPEMTDWFYEAQYGLRTLSQEQGARLGAFVQRLREDPGFGTR